MSSVYGLNFWQYNGYFGDNMNRSEFGTADNDNTSRGGHTYVEQEETTEGGCPDADAGSSGQTIGEPWNYINWQISISETYTRVWWGWFVPSYSGPLWLQTASDDSSLVYVSEDEFGQPTKSSNRTDVKTAAGDFSDITLVVNNGGAHPTVYKSGSIDVVANKAYFIRIYFGENGGGDNMHFSWNDRDPQDSTSNIMNYVKLDGSQSDKVLFYYNYPFQPTNAPAFPVDVSLGIVSWYDGDSFDTTHNKWVDKAGSLDLSSDYINGTISKKTLLFDSVLISNRNNKRYNQTKFPVYLSGNKDSGITFNKNASYQFLTDGSYTFFHAARRDPNDVNQTGRVFDGSGVDWYSGFNDASSGVAKHENGSSINTIDKEYGTNWVVSVDTPEYYRSVGYSDTSSGYYDTSSGDRAGTNTTSPQISVHYGSNTFQSTAQQCDWNVGEVISYNRILNITEENKVFDYLKHRYLGTGQSTTGEVYQLPGDISGGATIRGFPPEFPDTNNILGWYIPESYDVNGFWRDVSPFKNDLSSVGTAPEYVKNDNTYTTLSYLKGVKADYFNEIVASGYKFPEFFLPSDGSYTMIHVSRRISNTGRIFDSASNNNFYSGFVGNKSGVALHSIDMSSSL